MMLHWRTRLRNHRGGRRKHLGEKKVSAKTKLFWGKSLPHFEDKQWAADCWPWSAPIVDVEMNGNGFPNQYPLFDLPQNHVKWYSELPKAITFAHDRLCDPWFWSLGDLAGSWNLMVFYVIRTWTTCGTTSGFLWQPCWKSALEHILIVYFLISSLVCMTCPTAAHVRRTTSFWFRFLLVTSIFSEATWKFSLPCYLWIPLCLAPTTLDANPAGTCEESEFCEKAVAPWCPLEAIASTCATTSDCRFENRHGGLLGAS